MNPPLPREPQEWQRETPSIRLDGLTRSGSSSTVFGVCLQGGFAKCYWAKCMDSDQAFAMKVVSKASLQKSRARHKVRGCMHAPTSRWSHALPMVPGG